MIDNFVRYCNILEGFFLTAKNGLQPDIVSHCNRVRSELCFCHSDQIIQNKLVTSITTLAICSLLITPGVATAMGGTWN